MTGQAGLVWGQAGLGQPGDEKDGPQPGPGWAGPGQSIFFQKYGAQKIVKV